MVKAFRQGNCLIHRVNVSRTRSVTRTSDDRWPHPPQTQQTRAYRTLPADSPRTVRRLQFHLLARSPFRVARRARGTPQPLRVVIHFDLRILTGPFSGGIFRPIVRELIGEAEMGSPEPTAVAAADNWATTRPRWPRGWSPSTERQPRCAASWAPSSRRSTSSAVPGARTRTSRSPRFTPNGRTRRPDQQRLADNAREAVGHRCHLREDGTGAGRPVPGAGQFHLTDLAEIARPKRPLRNAFRPFATVKDDCHECPRRFHCPEFQRTAGGGSRNEQQPDRLRARLDQLEGDLQPLVQTWSGDAQAAYLIQKKQWEQAARIWRSCSVRSCRAGQHQHRLHRCAAPHRRRVQLNGPSNRPTGIHGACVTRMTSSKRGNDSGGDDVPAPRAPGAAADGDPAGRGSVRRPALPERQSGGMSTWLMVLPALGGLGAMALIFTAGGTGAHIAAGVMFGVSTLAMVGGQLARVGGDRIPADRRRTARLPPAPGADPPQGQVGGRGPGGGAVLVASRPARPAVADPHQPVVGTPTDRSRLRHRPARPRRPGAGPGPAARRGEAAGGRRHRRRRSPSAGSCAPTAPCGAPGRPVAAVVRPGPAGGQSGRLPGGWRPR